MCYLEYHNQSELKHCENTQYFLKTFSRTAGNTKDLAIVRIF